MFYFSKERKKEGKNEGFFFFSNKREINEDIIETKDSLVSEINKLSKSLNTLSTKVDWVSSRVKDLEDKSNGLEIM